MQGEAIERLERSVLAYQSEREQLARAFDQLKHQIRDPMSAKLPEPAEAASLPPSLLHKFETFAQGHLGCAFDPSVAVSTFDSGRLFEPGTDRIMLEARGWLRAYASLLRDPEARDVGLRVVALTDAEPVEPRGTEPAAPRTRASRPRPSGPDPRPARDLGRDRRLPDRGRRRQRIESAGPTD